MQVQTNQRKGQRNWLCSGSGSLSGEGIHDMLVDEGRISLDEAIGAEFVVFVQLGIVIVHGIS